MKLFFLIFIMLSTSLSTMADFRHQAVYQPAIVGGSLVPKKETAIYHATPRLNIVNEANEEEPLKFCTGVLIAPDLVLTAAHCLEEDPVNLQVEVEFFDVIVKAKAYIVHEKYTPLAYENVPGSTRKERRQIGGFNDIALILLDQPMSHLTAALLPPAAWPMKDDTPVKIAGYGKTDIDYDEGDGKLRWTDGYASEFSHNRLFISGNNTTSCHGDSGGPSYIVKGHQYMVVGIVSTGDCTHSAKHTRVRSFLGWIQTTTEQLRSTVRGI